MLNKIIQFSLQNRLFILIASVLLMIGGLYQAYHTEVDVFPDLNAPTVVVMTEAGGMAAEEVEQLVTFPIETAVNGATSVRRVRSSSTTGFSVVWVDGHLPGPSNRIGKAGHSGGKPARQCG
jgi:Cu/Ag efflux pump CusA